MRWPGSGGGRKGISRHFSIISSGARWRGVLTSGGGGGDRREAKGAGRSEEDISVSSPSRLSPRFHGRGAVPPALREAGVRAALSPLPSPTAPGARRFARLLGAAGA